MVITKHNQLITSTINDGSNIGFYNDDVGLRSLYTDSISCPKSVALLFCYYIVAQLKFDQNPHGTSQGSTSRHLSLDSSSSSSCAASNMRKVKHHMCIYLYNYTELAQTDSTWAMTNMILYIYIMMHTYKYSIYIRIYMHQPYTHLLSFKHRNQRAAVIPSPLKKYV